MLPSRVWELLIGATCALILTRVNISVHSQLLRQIFALFGLILIVVPVLLYSASTPFPGYAALLPVVGSALVILFATESTFVNRVLRHRWLVIIGLVSYSAYLWHQPLFAFFKYQSLFNPNQLHMLLITAAVFPLSYLTWRFVEKPFRNKDRISTRQLWIFAALGAFCLTLIGVLGHAFNGFPERFKNPPNIIWKSLGDKIQNLGKVCDEMPVTEGANVLSCEFGDTASDKVVAIYGDSHADSLMYKFDEHFKRLNIRGLRVSLRDWALFLLFIDCQLQILFLTTAVAGMILIILHHSSIRKLMLSL